MIKNIKSRKKFMLVYSILVTVFATVASFYGLHFFITNVLGASLNASLFILAPGVILYIPVAIFSLYVGYKRYYGDESIRKYGKTTLEQAITIVVISGYGVLSIFGIGGGRVLAPLTQSTGIGSGDDVSITGNPFDCELPANRDNILALLNDEVNLEHGCPSIP